MLTRNDVDDFIHVTRQDDGFIILQKSMDEDEDRHQWSIIKPGFEFSLAYTQLKTARDFAIELLSLLGVPLMKDGLRLAIEIIKETPDEPAVKGRVKN